MESILGTSTVTGSCKSERRGAWVEIAPSKSFNFLNQFQRFHHKVEVSLSVGLRDQSTSIPSHLPGLLHSPLWHFPVYQANLSCSSVKVHQTLSTSFLTCKFPCNKTPNLNSADNRKPIVCTPHPGLSEKRKRFLSTACEHLQFCSVT